MALMEKAAFLDRLEDYLREQAGVLCFLDIHGFNQINLALGYHTGDRVLAVARRRVDRLGLPACHWHGDQFLCWSGAAPDGAQLDTLNAPLLLDEMAYPLRWSMVCVPADGQARVAAWIANAQRLSGQKKGRLGDITPAQLATRAVLQKALQGGSLEPAFQPIWTIDGQLLGFEVLARWPQGPGPGEFIPWAEAAQLGDPLNRQVMAQAIGLTAKALRDSPFWLAVNPGTALLKAPDAVAWLDQVRDRHGLRADQIVLELSERTNHLADGLPERLAVWQRAGYGLSLDDFGTEYANLDVIQRLGIAHVKLDRSLLPGEDHRPLAGLVQYLRHLGVRQIVAEGLEDVARLRELAQAGVDAVQGYALGRPGRWHPVWSAAQK